ncbi:MAG: hypothetical protein M0R40_04290 [Firmicutes bacterium]|nr:hypothetical protein [Bacillota bacterium]
MHEITKEYSRVRGFNFQPDWGATGVTVWQKFDPVRYRELIQAGKEAFPGINTLRIWLSFDAWCEDKKLFLSNVRTAMDIITSSGLACIPTYFNGWSSIPNFGGFAASILKHISKRDYEPYRTYLRESMEATKKGNILIHDISNEPFNSVVKNPPWIEVVINFLKAMAEEARETDDRPITVGSQGFALNEERTYYDIDALAGFTDVISIHPYKVGDPQGEGENRLIKLLELVDKYKKPVIITECIWGSEDEKGHVETIKQDLAVFNKYNIGFLAHALCTSPVADLHPLRGKDALTCLGIYMAFLDEDLNIRKGHEVFNNY